MVTPKITKRYGRSSGVSKRSYDQEEWGSAFIDSPDQRASTDTKLVSEPEPRRPSLPRRKLIVDDVGSSQEEVDKHVGKTHVVTRVVAESLKTSETRPSLLKASRKTSLFSTESESNEEVGPGESTLPIERTRPQNVHQENIKQPETPVRSVRLTRSSARTSSPVVSGSSKSSDVEASKEIAEKPSDELKKPETPVRAVRLARSQARKSSPIVSGESTIKKVPPHLPGVETRKDDKEVANKTKCQPETPIRSMRLTRSRARSSSPIISDQSTISNSLAIQSEGAQKDKEVTKLQPETPARTVRLTRSRAKASQSPIASATPTKSESSQSKIGLQSDGTQKDTVEKPKDAINCSKLLNPSPVVSNEFVTPTKSESSQSMDVASDDDQKNEERTNDSTKDDGLVEEPGIGPKRLFSSTEGSGLRETSIFASGPRRKIKHLRTSSGHASPSSPVADIDPRPKSMTSSSISGPSFGSSSFESSQSSQASQDPIRTPSSSIKMSSRRTFGASRTYLADSPTKTEDHYASMASESSEESENEELHIKSVHELRETGGNTRFMDEMEYLAEGLEEEGSGRRTTLLEICKKAKTPDFVRKLKTTHYADRILNVLPQVVESDRVASFLVLFVAQKIFEDNGANVLDNVISDPKFLNSVFLCLDNTESILEDKKSSKVFQQVLKQFVESTSVSLKDDPTPSPALAAIATLSTLQTYPGASGTTILNACLLPTNWAKFHEFATTSFENKEYKVLQLVVFFLDFCQSDSFFPSLADILDDVLALLKKGKPPQSSALVDLSLPVLRLLIVLTNDTKIPSLDTPFVLKCISFAEVLHKYSDITKLHELYLLCLGFLENIIDVLTDDYQSVYNTFTKLSQGEDDKHCLAFLVLLRKKVARKGGLQLSFQEEKELE